MILFFCSLLLAAPPLPPPSLDAEKVLLVEHGRLQRWQRAPKTRAWERAGAAMRVVAGKNGIARDKVEGDLRTPAGEFRLLLATGYDRRPPAGTTIDYLRATASLKCVDDPRSKYYNQIVDETRVAKDWKSAEDMLLPDDRYRRVLVVGYNVEPTTPGKGSCIFIHAWRGPDSTTAGCIALALEDVEILMAWVDKNTRLIVLTP